MADFLGNLNSYFVSTAFVSQIKKKEKTCYLHKFYYKIVTNFQQNDTENYLKI